MPRFASLRNVLKSNSSLEKQLKEALCNEKWNAPNSLLHDIALSTENEPGSRKIILDAVWKVLDGNQWRQVFKALALVETLLKRGSLATIEELGANTWRFQKWTDHHHYEGGVDVARGIREKSGNILSLLDDIPRLNDERKKNYLLHQKMEGVGGTQPRSRTSLRVNRRTSERGRTPQEEPKLGFHRVTEAEMEAAGAEDRNSTGKPKPDFQTLRVSIERVQKATGVSAGRALQLLKESDWDDGAAIFLYGMEAADVESEQKPVLTPTYGPVTPSEVAASDSESDSDSSSSSSSSSESQPRGSTADSPRKGGGKGDGMQMGWQGKGARAQNTWSPSAGGWPQDGSGTPGAKGWQQNSGFPGAGMQGKGAGQKGFGGQFGGCGQQHCGGFAGKGQGAQGCGTQQVQFGKGASGQFGKGYQPAVYGAGGQTMGVKGTFGTSAQRAW